MTGHASPEERARAAWEAMLEHALRRRGVASGPGQRDNVAVWPYSQVVAAALDMAMLTGDAAISTTAFDLLRRLRSYIGPQGYAPFPGVLDEVYYDDNAWVGLDFVQSYLVAGSAEHLALGARVLDWVRAGAEPGGGVRWVSHAGSPRNTCATAPAAQLALRLHLVRADRDLLAFAQEQMRWLDDCLRTEAGTYADHLRVDGTVDPSVWSYNQGTPIGAKVSLARATGDETHLDEAVAVARAALVVFDDDALWAQPPVFNAIFFRNLLHVDAMRSLPAARALLDRYLERLWYEARDVATGYFGGGGIGRYEQGGTVDQAGVVQCFAVAAMSRDELATVC